MKSRLWKLAGERSSRFFVEDALPHELPKVCAVDQELFGEDHGLPVHVAREWLAHDSGSIKVLRKNEASLEVVGYFIVLFLRSHIVERLLLQRVRIIDLRSSDIGSSVSKYTARAAYLGSFVLLSSGVASLRALLGSLQEYIGHFVTFGDLRTVYALPYSDGGRKILERAGFEKIEEVESIYWDLSFDESFEVRPEEYPTSKFSERLRAKLPFIFLQNPRKALENRATSEAASKGAVEAWALYLRRGAELYYLCEQSDGSQPASSQGELIFDQSDQLGSEVRKTDLLLGLGCGSASTDLSVLRGIGSCVSSRYLGVDISLDMLVHAHKELSESGADYRLVCADFFSEAYVCWQRDFLREYRRISISLLGGTFGNYNAGAILSIIQRIAPPGSLVLIDCNVVQKNDASPFIKGMEAEAEEDLLLFLNGIGLMGVRGDEVQLGTEFSYNALGVRCNFTAEMTRDVMSEAGLLHKGSKIEVFSTQAYYHDALIGIMGEYGCTVIDTVSMNNPNRPQCIIGAIAHGEKV